MKITFTKIITITILIFSVSIANASDFNTLLKKKKKAKKDTNHLMGIGWGSFLSGGQNGNFTYYTQDTNSVDYARKQKAGGIDILFIGYQYHYTLSNINKDKSITLHTFPTLGLNLQSVIGGEGLGGIQFPVFINYNSGAGATTKSREDKGFTVGAGFEFITTSLFSLSKISNIAIYNSSFNKRKNVIQPAINIGYRYINDNDKMREWNLKAGYMPRTLADKFGNTIPYATNAASFWLRLSLTYYLD
jgi:hypothetical protein